MISYNWSLFPTLVQSSYFLLEKKTRLMLPFTRKLISSVNITILDIEIDVRPPIEIINRSNHNDISTRYLDHSKSLLPVMTLDMLDAMSLRRVLLSQYSKHGFSMDRFHASLLEGMCRRKTRY